MAVALMPTGPEQICLSPEWISLGLFVFVIVVAPAAAPATVGVF